MFEYITAKLMWKAMTFLDEKMLFSKLFLANFPFSVLLNIMSDFLSPPHTPCSFVLFFLASRCRKHVFMNKKNR